jgi:acyl-CoA synthetase (NDP forming)
VRDPPCLPAGAIERLLRPRSVAVVGASSTPGALGTSVIANLDRGGYQGSVFLINPKRDEIGGRRCLKSVDELPMGVDAAVLAIPHGAVLETVRALVRRQVGAAIIFSSGFAEGGEQGLQQQREIARLATASGMVIEGPNCLGLVNNVDGIALTFVETPATTLGGRPGIGIVSQSGAMACVLSVSLSSRELGISYSLSTGNEAASGVEDYLEYLLADSMTGVIGMIVEQFRQPARLLALAWRAREIGKTIVLLHPGRSAAARQSAATHTGAMAGDYQMMRTQVERQGVLLAENLEELGDILELAFRCNKRPAPGTMFITESGAFKALTLDLSEQLGLALPSLSDASAPLLRAALPSFVPVSNPLDLTAQALVDPDIYRRSLQAIISDERFGTIALGIIQTDATTSDIKFPTIIAALQTMKPEKAVIFAGLDEGAVVPVHYIRELRAEGVPYFPSPDRALRALARLNALAERDLAASDAPPIRFTGALPAAGVVPEYLCKQLLRPLGFPVPSGCLVTTLDQAQRAVTDIGFPVALKAQSVDLSHKSDVGGVVLGLRDAQTLAEGWSRLHANIARHRPGLALDGVLIERMSPPGLELIVGARQDPEWGPVVLVGFGGVGAELLKDTRLLAPDLTRDAIVRELQLLKGSALLRGFRGSPALDVESVAQIIARVGALLRGEPSIQELDLNPVIVYPEGAIALDALMIIGTPEESEWPR